MTRRAISITVAALAALALVLSACSDDGGAAETAAQAQAADRLLPVQLSDFALTPAALNATVEEDITIAITNAGGTDHDFTVEGVAQTPLIRPGEQTALHLGKLAAGTYNLLCSVPGHADLGMHGTLVVSGAAAAAARTPPRRAPGAVPNTHDHWRRDRSHGGLYPLSERPSRPRGTPPPGGRGAWRDLARIRGQAAPPTAAGPRGPAPLLGPPAGRHLDAQA